MRYNKDELENINLKKLRPELAKQWHYGKNKPLRPEDISIYSHKKVWWKCGKRHTWQATVAARARYGYGCPICSNRIVLPGYNDLETLRPDIAAEWAKWLNKLKPSEVGVHSNKKVWWNCHNDHFWEAKINDRTRKNKGTGCPYCAKKRKWKK